MNNFCLPPDFRNLMLRIRLSVFLSLLCVGLVQAQTTNLTGKVVDATQNQPLPGVSVAIKGTTRGTTTAADGTFQLGGVAPTDVLVFSFVG